MTAITSWASLVGMALLSGCITEATWELTKAPFDATTALTDSSSRAIGELLEPTQKFISSTTPGTVAIDRFTRAREKTELFVGYSYEHLRTESARGAGEHLASLAVLAGIPPDRRSRFQETMRETYTALFHDSFSPRDSRDRIVNVAWAEGWGRLESDTIKHEETGLSEVDLKLGQPQRNTALMSLR